MPYTPRSIAALAPVIALGAGLAGPVSAQASATNVRTAVQRQTREVTNSPAARRLRAATASNASQARKLVGPLEAYERRLHRAATDVSHASTSSSTQRTARTDWVSGIRDDARAFGQLATAFRDLERGDKTGARREVANAKRTALAADKLVLRADSKLKLRTA